MATKKTPKIIYGSAYLVEIKIEEQRLNVKLRKYTDAIKNSDDWFGRLLGAITITFTLITSSFKDLFFIKAEFLEAFCLLLCFWLWVLSVKAAYVAWKNRNISPESFIKEIKDEMEIKNIPTTTKF